MTNSLLSTITGLNDVDPAETREWIEALQAVLEHDGSERVHFLIEQLVVHGSIKGVLCVRILFHNDVAAAAAVLYEGFHERARERPRRFASLDFIVCRHQQQCGDCNKQHTKPDVPFNGVAKGVEHGTH